LGRIGAAVASAQRVPQIGYGLHLTLERYHALMRDYARHLGATERSCRKLEPKLRAEDGFVDALVLDEGLAVTGDLFVDCTGPAASVRAALDDGFEEWRNWLTGDRLIFAEAQPDTGAPMLDRATAATAGWQWKASSPSCSSRGAVYSSAHASTDEMHRELGDSAQDAIEIG